MGTNGLRKQAGGVVAARQHHGIQEIGDSQRFAMKKSSRCAEFADVHSASRDDDLQLQKLRVLLGKAQNDGACHHFGE
jgi:hypothetical protein